VGSDDPHTVVLSEAGRRSTEEKLTPTLTVLEGPEVGAFFSLGEGEGSYTLGRAEDADLQIAAASVSRHHVQLEVGRKAGRPAINVRDNGSTNGILVNGQMVEEMWLVSGDKIRAGDVLLRFEWMSSAEVRYHRDVSNKLHAGARDHLTGLLNRAFLEQRLGPVLDEVDRREQSACCLMLDLDHFKAVNDNYGHPAGDQVLRRVSAVVQEGLRRTDYAVRYGGEEILLLMPDLALDWGFEVAERIRCRIGKIDFSDVAEGLTVTASIGVALREAGEGADSWIARADEALYRAKAGGRDRTLVADDPAAAATDPRLRATRSKTDTRSTHPRTAAPALGGGETEEMDSELLD